MSSTEQERARDHAAYVAALRKEHEDLMARGFHYSARVVADRIALAEGDDD